MPDFSLVRADKYIWTARLLQLVFTMVILAVTGDGASDWKSIDCYIPTKLAFNIAAVSSPSPSSFSLSFSPLSFSLSLSLKARVLQF